MVFHVNSGCYAGIHLGFGKCINHPKQGIRIDCNKPLSYNGKSSHALVFWKGSTQTDFNIGCPCNANLSIRNVWDYGDGVEQSWHAGGAMVVEQDNRTIRIRANSTLQNDFCEDLHCELTWLDEAPHFKENQGFFTRLFRKYQSGFVWFSKLGCIC